jgi:hypothetical protein
MTDDDRTRALAARLAALPPDVTPADRLVLAVAALHDGPPPPGQLEAATGLAPRTIAAALNRLAALGLITAPGQAPRWCDEHGRYECRHRRQDATWCHQWCTIPGTGECRKHGGMTLDRLRAKGQANLAAPRPAPGPP